VTTRTIRFIPAPAAALPAEPGVEQVVLDTSWTPTAGDRSDLRSLRPLVAGVLRERNPLAEAMTLVDDWAARAGLVERLEVDGVSHWHRRRIVYWRWLHDRLIWRWVLAALQAERPIERFELGPGEPELGQVLGILAVHEGAAVSIASAPEVGIRPVTGRPDPSRIPFVDRFQARSRRRSLAARTAVLAGRVDRLGRAGGGLLVLTDPTVHQTVTSAGTTGRIDPFLGPVIDALRRTRLNPVVFEFGTRSADDRTWAELQAAGRERALPGSILAETCADPADEVRAAAASIGMAERLAGSLPPLEVDGLDLGLPILAELRTFAGKGIASELRQEARIGRLLDRLRPEAILTINEYSRPEWIIAAHRQGVPITAVQHGIIHPLHAGYILPGRPPSLALVDRTYLFGAYEARLLTGASVYRADEVVVTGAPRLDLYEAHALEPAERASVRAELGVAPGARLVVFSSTSSAAVRRTVIAAAFELILDRPWPGVHLVVKLHPGEDDGAFYPALVEGLARARGFPPRR